MSTPAPKVGLRSNPMQSGWPELRLTTPCAGRGWKVVTTSSTRPAPDSAMRALPAPSRVRPWGWFSPRATTVGDPGATWSRAPSVSEMARTVAAGVSATSSARGIPSARLVIAPPAAGTRSIRPAYSSATSSPPLASGQIPVGRSNPPIVLRICPWVVVTRIRPLGLSGTTRLPSWAEMPSTPSCPETGVRRRTGAAVAPAMATTVSDF